MPRLLLAQGFVQHGAQVHAEMRGLSPIGQGQLDHLAHQRRAQKPQMSLQFVARYEVGGLVPIGRLFARERRRPVFIDHHGVVRERPQPFVQGVHPVQTQIHAGLTVAHHRHHARASGFQNGPGLLPAKERLAPTEVEIGLHLTRILQLASAVVFDGRGLQLHAIEQVGLEGALEHHPTAVSFEAQAGHAGLKPNQALQLSQAHVGHRRRKDQLGRLSTVAAGQGHLLGYAGAAPQIQARPTTGHGTDMKGRPSGHPAGP